MMRAWVEWLFQWRAVRWLAGLAFIARAASFQLCGKTYRALNDYCWVVRVSQVGPLQRFARGPIDRELAVTRRGERNTLIDAFLESSLSGQCASTYSLAGTGTNDLFRDLIVLKRATAAEKGVILLKYARTFEAVVALLDFDRLRRRYIFVLEPCWAGYCDPALLMYSTPGDPVIVQCFTADDRAFIDGLGPPFVPVALGPADWVDAGIFRESASCPKTFDLVMVANWGLHKRHGQLFRALRDIDDRDVRVLLVGFPWAGRTASDLRQEVDAIGNPRIQVQIVERISQAELAGYLSRCKVFVFLSKKEGDNKALVEAMFADVPAIVYDRSIGGAVGRINSATGILSSDADLTANIRHMLDHFAEFSPRAWALQHTGSPIATRILEAALRDSVRNSGGRYEDGIAEKANTPNLAYRDPALRDAYQADYEFITSCLRSPPVP